MDTAVRPDHVAIARMRVRGDDSARKRVQHALESATWPRPGADEWIFIRRVAVRARVSDAADRVLDRTRNALSAGRDSDGEQAMRFESLNALVAALLADLADGRAADHWYWRRWARLFTLPPGRAIATLLHEHLARVPALTECLARQHRLARVWSLLARDDAERLGAALAAHAGYRVSRVHEARDGRSTRGVPLALTLPETLRRRWDAPLRELPRDDARRRLALQLIAGEIAPLALLHAPTAVLQQLDDLLPGERVTGDAVAARSASAPVPGVNEIGSAAGDDVGTEQRDITLSAHRHRSALHGDDTLQGGAVASNNRPERTDSVVREAARDCPTTDASSRTDANGSDQASDAGAGQGRSVVAPGAEPTPQRHARTATPDAISPSRSLRIDAPAVRHPELDSFATSQAGLFRLLNVLNRPEARGLMDVHWQVLNSGWAWLYRLGQTLALDESDAITAFLATRLGFDNPEALSTLAPLPARRDLLGLAARWYGPPGLWRPDLLALDARVHATPSHIDIHAPLAGVRLDVRVAGLDLDPGWLPWLGCVVRFHYD